MLRGELGLGIGIGIVKKVGDKVCRRIGVGDCDVVDQPSVPMCADFGPEVGCVLVDCASGVKEGWLVPAVWEDGGMVGDDISVLLGSCVDNTIVIDLGIGVGCGGKDIGRCAVRLVGLR